MRKKRKRLPFVSTLLVCAMLAAVLAACGKSDATKPASSPAASGSPKATEANVYQENGLPKDQKVTLKVGFYEAGMGRKWFDYAIDTFKKKFPNVSFEVVYSPKISSVTGTKISANNDDDMFDLFSGGVPGGDPAITSLVQAGKLEPQEDLWDRKTYDGTGKSLKELVLPGQYETAPRNLGKTYALPIAATGTGLFFNKKLFEENGWNQNPKTWAEFLQLCEAIKAKGIIPITYPGQYPGYLDYAFTGPWKAFELADATGNLTKFEETYRNSQTPFYTSPENTELWNHVYDLGKKGYFPAGVAGLNHTQSQMQVLQGKAAMASTGVWVGNEMKDSTPEGFRWGFMVVPMGDKPDSAKWTRFSSGNGNHIWAGKPELNKKWAKEFNLWLWNMDVQQSIAEDGGQLPMRKDYTDDKQRADRLQDVAKAMLEYMNANKVRGESGYMKVSLTDPAAAQAKKVISEMVTQVTEGKQDPLPKLREADELLKKANDAQKK